jgi:nucleoid-associated protein YgaU
MTFRKGSRYADAARFAPDDAGQVPFAGVRARSIGPATPVIEHEVTAGDRLDLLALNYYQDDRLWWRIADANPEFLFAGSLLYETLPEEELAALGSLSPEEQAEATRNLRPGSVILIPKARE